MMVDYHIMLIIRAGHVYFLKETWLGPSFIEKTAMVSRGSSMARTSCRLLKAVLDVELSQDIDGLKFLQLQQSLPCRYVVEYLQECPIRLVESLQAALSA
jgi:hypothetical protein